MINNKLVVVLFAALLAFSAFPLLADAAPETNKAEIVNGVNFRSAPSTSGKLIRLLKTGEIVTVVHKVNAHWYQIKDSQNRSGYMSTMDKYIRLLTSSSQNGSGSSNATAVSSVSFRTGPSTESKRIRYLSKGEAIVIIEQVNAYWYKVKDQSGQSGYVSSNTKYVSTTYQEPANQGTPQSTASQQAQRIIAAGKKYLGTPYEYGSSRNDTSTFDCSAFVRQAFLDGIGLKLPADSRQQGAYVKDSGDTTTNWRQLKPGDIMFFMSYKGPSLSDYKGINKSTQTISHDGIYLGDGKVLHTYSAASGGVRIDSIEGKHWEHRFLFGGSAK